MSTKLVILLKSSPEYNCGHQINQSNHRDGCEGGQKCSQSHQTRIPEKFARPCRKCVAATASETWEKVKGPVEDGYLHKSVHQDFFKKLDKTSEKADNFLVKSGTAVLERVASRLTIQRIEKRLVARGKARTLEEAPVIVEGNDADDELQGDDEAWERVESEDGDWVEVSHGEGDLRVL